MKEITVGTDMPGAIEVIRHVGAWMRDTGIANYSEWWDPDKVSAEMLGPYAKPDEFFVVKANGEPAAAAIIQAEQSLQDWGSVDKDGDAPNATYIHYIVVERTFAGQGLVGVIMDKATEIAKQQKATVLRLDTDANEPKLCALYEGFGFVRVGQSQDGDHLNALYEKTVQY